LEYATMMMEAAGFLGMLEHIYQTTQHHIPQAWLNMKLEIK
jgi:hypothetical protein